MMNRCFQARRTGPGSWRFWEGNKWVRFLDSALRQQQVFICCTTSRNWRSSWSFHIMNSCWASYVHQPIKRASSDTFSQSFLLIRAFFFPSDRCWDGEQTAETAPAALQRLKLAFQEGHPLSVIWAVNEQRSAGLLGNHSAVQILEMMH